MSTVGDRLGRGLVNLGVGVSQKPPTQVEYTPLHFTKFSGLQVDASPLDVGPDGAVQTFGLMIDETGSLAHELTPTTVRSAEAHNLKYLLSFGSFKIVAIDPPFLAEVADLVSPLVWFNFGLPAGTSFGYDSVKHGTKLAFIPGGGSAQGFTWNGGFAAPLHMPDGRCITSQFGRIFIGGPIGDGVVAPGAPGLPGGVAWSDSTGSATGWSFPAGATSEDLIDATPGPTEVNGIAAIGTELLAILKQSAIWLGYPTGQVNRPADFRLRRAGNGCWAPRTVQVTDIGVIYLAIDGLRVFDGDTSHLLSNSINKMLLPQLTFDFQWRGLYDNVKRLYYLWNGNGNRLTYHLPYGNRPGGWSNTSSVSGTSSVMFGQGSSDPRLRKAHFGVGNSLVGLEEFVAPTAQAEWTTGRQGNPTDLVTIQKVEIEYATFDANTLVTVFTPNTAGTMVALFAASLPNTGGAVRTKEVYINMTGLRAQVQLQMISNGVTTRPRISRATLWVAPAGPESSSQ